MMKTNLRFGGKLWLLDIYMYDEMFGWYKVFTRKFKTYDDALVAKESYK